MANLKTNFKDDILNSNVNEKRRYNLIQNEDGTVSFEDVTDYSQMGDYFGAGYLNQTNQEVNNRLEKSSIIKESATIRALTQNGFVADALLVKGMDKQLSGVSLVVDPETGKLTGYTTEIGGADSVFPFKGETAVVQFSTTHNSGANETGSWTATKTISTGLKVSEIIHVSPLITSQGTRASVKIDSIADNGDITVTMSGGDGSTYGGWYIISTVTLDIVLYKYPEAEIIREYTKTGVTASSAFSGYAYASAADKNKTTHWLPANTDAAPRAIFTFLDPFVLKRIDALFCNTSGNVIEDVSVTISGSNDNRVFEPIQTFGGISLKSFSKVSTDPLESYEINNEKSYKYYMIEFNKAMAGITEVEFFGTLW